MKGGIVFEMLADTVMPVILLVVLEQVISGQVHGFEEEVQWSMEGGFDQNCLRFRRICCSWEFP